jgi:hypothetical protein
VSLSDRLLALAPRNPEPRVLTLDIETLPGSALFFSRKVDYIGVHNILSSPRMGCFAAKWLGAAKVEFAGEFHDGREQMLGLMWDLLNEADMVVSWNGDSFDLPWIRGELATAGYSPPSAFQSIDLIKTARSFRLVSNRLDDVAKVYGVGRKMETGGIDLWKGCLAGDRKAWDKMRRYNRGDVLITERLLTALGPWVKGMPHRGQWTRDRECCPSCGGTDLTLVGISYSKTLEYPKLRCDTCDKYCRVLRNGDTRPA